MIPWRRSLPPLACLLATFSLAIYVTGGFFTSVIGLRVSARSPLPSAAAAACAIAAWLILAYRARALRDDLSHAHGWLSIHANALVATVAAMAGAIAVRYATFSAAGSDPSGYLSQAVMLGHGELMRAEPLATSAHWPNAAATLAPLGWNAWLESALQVPTYAVGLPSLMMPLHAVGGTTAACLIVAASLVVAVWATGTLALRVAGPAAAMIAAVWLATSPVALIEAMQPMSDVPVTAAWLVCWVLIVSAGLPSVRSRALRAGKPGPSGDFKQTPEGPGLSRIIAAGVAAALAVLIRPNLAPLAAVPALWLMRGSPGAAAAFSAPVALAGLFVAYLQWLYFGSPWRSGYGTAEEIYATSNVAPNAALYTRWLLEAHGPWLLAAPVAIFGPASRARSTRRWLLVFAALVVLQYLCYGTTDVWTYLRFLLPALAIAMIAVAAIAAAVIARLPIAAHAPVLGVILLVLAASNMASARSLGVFRFAALQSRAALAGRYLGASLPAQSVVIAGEQSGAVRYYTDRSIVRWDFLAPDSVGQVSEQLTSKGYDVWIALDDWEEELFRRKFPSTPVAALDWPPRVEAGSGVVTRAWRARDREPFLRGEQVMTDRLR